MMKRIGIILLAVLLLPCAVELWAQTKDKKALPKVKPIPAFWGKSEVFEGPVQEEAFDKLMKQGITARDSAGNAYKVTSFAFTYAERNFYEDSVGNLMLLTDYLTEYSFSDTFSTFLLNNITERSKPGDTVYVDNITLTTPDGKGAHGRAMKFYLTK